MILQELGKQMRGAERILLRALADPALDLGSEVLCDAGHAGADIGSRFIGRALSASPVFLTFSH